MKKIVQAELTTELPENFPVNIERVSIFYCNDKWFGHSIGEWVGTIYADGSKKSAFKDDDNSELFEQLRSAGILKCFHRTKRKKLSLELIECNDYFLVRKVVDHCSNMPTVIQEGIEHVSNVMYFYTYEVCFAAGEGLVRYITVDIQTDGRGPVGLLNEVEYLQDTIEEWCELGTMGFRYGKGDSINVDFYEDTGMVVDIDFDDIDDLLLLITSIRIIHLESKIRDDSR